MKHGAKWDLITFCVRLQDPLNFIPANELNPPSQRGDFKPTDGLRVHKSPHVTSYGRNKGNTVSQAQSTTSKSMAEDLLSQKRQPDQVDVVSSKPSEVIIDLDSSTDTSRVNKNHVNPRLLDLNLTEEDLLPSRAYITSGSVTQGQGSKALLSQKGQEKSETNYDRSTHQSMTKSTPKHGDLITGSDGKKYRMLRGPPGPAGHPGKRVSHTMASKSYRGDDDK